MRITGYCTKCRRVKRVNAHVLSRGVSMGVCDACEEAERSAQGGLIIYVPKPGTAHSIAPGSAVVGRPVDAARVGVSFEGSIHGSADPRTTWEANLALAADRLLRRHPATQMRRTALVAVGAYDAARHRVLRIDDERTLSRWLRAPGDA